ncbi:ParB/RepB/Spo0J family partition protein [bacterium]|nr:ParB/RepB/Spo0J family partition protein [bacterium]
MTARPRQALGKGLAALIPGADEEENAKAPSTEVEIALIQTRPDQPRTRFAPEPLEELIQSVKAQGVLQPLLVTPREDKYLLVAGERRLRAARAAGLVKVPCRIIEGLDDQQILEISLVENLQREDLNPIELAHGYRRLNEDLGLGHQEVAERVGKDRTTVVNTLRLLKLPAPVVQLVVEGSLSAGHARALLAFPRESEQVAYANKIVAKGLSVRDIERAVQQSKKKKEESAKVAVPEPSDLHAHETAERIEESLGMTTRLNHKGPGGRLTIHYSNLDELDRLIDLLTRG